MNVSEMLGEMHMQSFRSVSFVAIHERGARLIIETHVTIGRPDGYLSPNP